LFSEGSRPHTTKIGCGHTGNESKWSNPAPGAKFISGPGQYVRFYSQDNNGSKNCNFKKDDQNILKFVSGLF
jgi:hypothetical protein